MSTPETDVNTLAPTISASSPAPASTPPAPTSSPAPASPPIIPKKSRYICIKKLQRSLYGSTQLYYDNYEKANVVIKISQIDLLKNNMSQLGVTVYENVMYEARLLRSIKKCISCHSSHHGLTVLPDDIDDGKQYIVSFVQEYIDAKYHYLVTSYANAGDLFSVLDAIPSHRVDEMVAKVWFRQMCLAIQYIHLRGVAHLDLSLENFCLNMPVADNYSTDNLMGSQVSLIDFGLSALHPNDCPPTLQQPHTRLTTNTAPIQCYCSACSLSTQRIQSRNDNLTRCGPYKRKPTQELRFLCRPACVNKGKHKPGKLRYFCPEIYSEGFWDAYKADIYSLGVILYGLLTGRLPYKIPDPARDVWFRVIFNGTWISDINVRNQIPANTYNFLSNEVLDLIDSLIKPQEQRPSIDQILNHPWMAPVTSSEGNQTDLNPVMMDLSSASYNKKITKACSI